MTLTELRDHAQEAINMTRGRSLANFEHDRMLELALTRLVELVGASARRVPSEDQALYPGIRWSDLVDAGDRLLHDYDDNNLELLRSVVERDLPPLVEQLDRTLR